MTMNTDGPVRSCQSEEGRQSGDGRVTRQSKEGIDTSEIEKNQIFLKF